MTATVPERTNAVPVPKFTAAEDAKPETADPVKIEDAPARVARLQRHLGYNVPAITLVLLTELGVDGVAHKVLYPLVVDRVHHILRENARRDFDQSQRDQTGERRQRAGGKGTPRPQLVVPGKLSRLAFLDFKVIMAGVPGGFKLYKDLTIPEHETRRTMLMRSAAPVLHSARSHDWAQQACERHKVVSLAGIPREILEKELPVEGIRP